MVNGSQSVCCLASFLLLRQAMLPTGLSVARGLHGPHCFHGFHGDAKFVHTRLYASSEAWAHVATCSRSWWQRNLLDVWIQTRQWNEPDSDQMAEPDRKHCEPERQQPWKMFHLPSLTYECIQHIRLLECWPCLGGLIDFDWCEG